MSAKFNSLCTCIDRIQQFHPQDKMIIAGDFNLNRVNWVNADILDFVTLEPVTELSRSSASKLQNVAAPMDMRQFYPQHRAKDYSLYLMFLNLALDITEAIDPLIKCDYHRIPAVFTFEPNKVDTVKYDRIVYDFKRANVQGISDALKDVDWEAAFADIDVDDNVSKFYQVLNEAVKFSSHAANSLPFSDVVQL